MELHLIRLAVVYRLILLFQQLIIIIGSLNSLSATAKQLLSSTEVDNDGVSMSSLSHRSYRAHIATDRLKFENLVRIASMRRAQDGRDKIMNRGPFINPQKTTTLMRFNSTGSVTDELEPRIDKYTSIKWLAKKSGFNPKLGTVFVLHGFLTLNLATQRWANDIRNLIYRWKDEANMYFVDWHHKSNSIFPIFYVASLRATLDIANDLHQIIKNLEAAFPQWDSSNIHLAGHSLGSHISGQLGYMMGGKINQITAMDPPDTLQENWPPEKKLTKDDAKYVITYVTDRHTLGSRYGQGHVNLLINGGSLQPGCFNPVCRHMRSAYINSDNLGKCIMVGYQADGYDQFLRGEVGYCEEDSDACVGAGNWWQYDDGLLMKEKHFRPGSNWRSSNQNSGISNNWQPYNREYYIKLAAQKPWCIFTYQIGVGFENITGNELKYIDKLHISLGMRGIESEYNVQVVLNKYSKTRFGRKRKGNLNSSQSVPNFGPGIFNESALDSGNNQDDSVPSHRQQRIKLGGNMTTHTIVYTGLALIEPGDVMYNLMPMKFERATIWLPGRTTKDAKIVGDGQQPQVYVNFMSDNRFERRQLYSGPVSKIHWFPPI